MFCVARDIGQEERREGGIKVEKQEREERREGGMKVKKESEVKGKRIVCVRF